MAMPEKNEPKKRTKSPAKGSDGAPRRSTAATKVRSGDRIVIDSSQVGSPPREGEILRVMTGGLGVSYEVRWADGHQSVISPAAGAARIVRPGR
jgi:Domain of unknown function (DUF1918)